MWWQYGISNLLPARFRAFRAVRLEHFVAVNEAADWGDPELGRWVIDDVRIDPIGRLHSRNNIFESDSSRSPLRRSDYHALLLWVMCRFLRIGNRKRFSKLKTSVSGKYPNT